MFGFICFSFLYYIFGKLYLRFSIIFGTKHLLSLRNIINRTRYSGWVLSLQNLCNSYTLSICDGQYAHQGCAKRTHSDWITPVNIQGCTLSFCWGWSFRHVPPEHLIIINNSILEQGNHFLQTYTCCFINIDVNCKRYWRSFRVTFGPRVANFKWW